MRIEKIRIENWRSVGKAEIGFNDFLMLTGKNNHGKSNILFAILYFFGRGKAELGDFFNGAPQLKISLFFRELSNRERQLFHTNGKAVEITKTAEAKNGQADYFCGNEKLDDLQMHYLLNEFAEVIFIPASRQTTEALNGNGENPYDQLIRVMAASALTVPNTFTSSTDLEKNEKLNIIKSALEQEMEDWDVGIGFQNRDNGGIDIRFEVKNGFEPALARKGHGFQRAIFFAIIRAWAKLIESGFRVSANDIPEEIILLYEEPELFLHPQAQRELLSALKTLTESGVRIILTTHSSFFVDLSRYQAVCIVQRKNMTEGTVVRQAKEDLFMLNEDVRNFNMNYWINPDRGELFFARKVILVEGPTEKVVLPKLAKKAGVFRHEDTLIDCGGKSNMPMYIALLNRFRVPYVAVYDSDRQHFRGRHGKATIELHTEMIERHIDRTLGDSVIFESDIEEELGIRDFDRKHKPFNALQFVLSDEFEMSGRLLMKLLKIFK